MLIANTYLGIGPSPEQWVGTCRRELINKGGTVRVNFQGWALEIKHHPEGTFNDQSCTRRPLIRKLRE